MKLDFTTHEIILASNSPRRHEILEAAKIPHRVILPDNPPNERAVTFDGNPRKFVEFLSYVKMSAFIDTVAQNSPKFDFLNGKKIIAVTSDTVVYEPEYCKKFGCVMGKPSDREQAIEMLTSLSGTFHWVYTGCNVAEISLDDGVKVTYRRVFNVGTKVFFRVLSRGEIESYVDAQSPFDKAGAYGIQESACVFVRKIDGDYFNIVGLPVVRVYEEIESILAGK